MKSKKIKIVLIILVVLLVIILCFSAGVYAAYVLGATDVSYTKPDGSTVSVKSALDEIYTMAQKPYSIGEEVTVGGEYFYVISDAGITVELLAKYVLNSEAVAQENEDTDCVFSTNNYWKNEKLPTSSPYFNLNTYPAVLNDTGSAVHKADSYAKSKGAVSGRLLTYEEANNLKYSYSDMIYVTYGKSKYYWLGSAMDGSGVWSIENGQVSGGLSYDDDNVGVRPVIKILKSKIS